MKNLVSQILLLFLLISGSNFLVELFTEGNINSFLEKPIKHLFITYMTLTVIILSIIASGLIVHTGYITIHLVIPMLLAFFHLYITYKITYTNKMIIISKRKINFEN